LFLRALPTGPFLGEHNKNIRHRRKDTERLRGAATAQIEHAELAEVAAPSLAAAEAAA
jgi:hypothetical protein